METFILVGYGDQQGYDQTSTTVRDTAHAHDAQLRSNGIQMGTAGSPVQVRNHGAESVVTTDGPYLSSELPVAGFGLIKAEDIDDAIAIAAQTPCAVAYGVVEVWPLNPA